ncbi:hypothetical protein VTN77DRAFT_4180 [Rasamsonia byssochlamydoides]|uniref:uncharacterized protein n=1 Tax=Rasamsonia byssochlamydoides TaxID=89139 RepID=UPI0037424C5E
MTEPMPPIEQQTPTERRQQAGTSSESSHVYLPRIMIKYCTQCKWMLRAAYFAQELLSTFNTSLGEVSLIPTTGGVFTVTIFHLSQDSLSTQETLLWDRKTHGGFPEVKQLKSLVRNIVDPSRDLGHVDRALGKENKGAESAPAAAATTAANANTTPARTVATDVNTPAGMGASGEREEKNEGKQKTCEDCQ